MDRGACALACEYAGIVPSGWLDKTALGHYLGAANPYTGATALTTNNTELFIGALTLAWGGSQTETVNNGFTYIGNAYNATGTTVDYVQKFATTKENANCTETSISIPYISCIATFVCQVGLSFTNPSNTQAISGESVTMNMTCTSPAYPSSTLSGYIFSWDDSGSYVNYTWTAFSQSQTQTVSIIKTITATPGSTVHWIIYANVTGNVWTASTIQSFTVSASITFNSPSNTTPENGKTVTMSVQATNVSTTYGLSGFIFSWNMSGSWVNQTWTAFPGSTNSWANTTLTLNCANIGYTVSWKIYGNDTGNGWTASSIYTFTDQATVTFICNAGGAFWRNGTEVANNSQTTYTSATTLMLQSLVNSGSGFQSFNWTNSAGSTTTNNYTFTVFNQTTISCFMGASSTPYITAAFNWTPGNPNAGAGITFSSYSTSSSAFTNYQWNFGDGNTTSGASYNTIVHQYGVNATYTVTLTVSSAAGTSAILETITIGYGLNLTLINPYICAAFNWAPSNPPTNSGITFTSQSSSSSAITNYQWNFGDGNITSGAGYSSIVHQYTGNATFTVTLGVTSAAGTASISTTITIGWGSNLTIIMPYIVSSFSWNVGAPSVNQVITFDGTHSASSSSVTNYQWNFGDGNTTSGASYSTITHAYANAGTYTVTLTVTSVAGSAALSNLVYCNNTFSAYLQAAFTYSPAHPDLNQAVSFDGSASVASSAITNYSWNFGDGNTTAGAGYKTITHAYASNSTFTVSLTVTSSLGTSQITEYVFVGYDAASWNAGNSSGYTLGYNTGWAGGNSTGYTNGYNAGWAAGNATGWANGNQTGYTNGWNAGNQTGYTNGYNSGYSTGYSAGYSQGYSDGNTTGYAQGWANGNQTGWNAGNATGWAQGNATGWAQGNATGYSNGYNAGWAAGNTTGWTNGNSTGYTQGWNSGNSTGWAQGNSTGWSQGNVTGYSNGYSAGFAAGQASVTWITAAFNFTATNPVVGQAATFTSYSSSSSSITNYSWNFGDGNTTEGNFATITHAFHANTTYPIKLTITSAAGVASIIEGITIGYGANLTLKTPYLQAAFTYNPSHPDLNQIVNFDGSMSASSETITSYSWTFGDGNTTVSSSTIAHAYGVNGTFSVTLTVSTSFGSNAITNYIMVGWDAGSYNAGFTAGNATGYSQGWTDGSNYGYTQGWNAGNSTGYTAGWAAGNATGWASGNATGYSVGWAAGNSTGYTNGYNNGYTNGYNAGYGDGYAVGNQSGYNAGWAAGNATGYQNGYNQGWSVGNSSGYNNGYSEGYTSGWAAGNQTGWTGGYSQGNYTGYNNGFNDGNITGWISGNSTGFAAGYAKGFIDGGNAQPHYCDLTVRPIDLGGNALADSVIFLNGVKHATTDAVYEGNHLLGVYVGNVTWQGILVNTFSIIAAGTNITYNLTCSVWNFTLNNATGHIGVDGNVTGVSWDGTFLKVDYAANTANTTLILSSGQRPIYLANLAFNDNTAWNNTTKMFTIQVPSSQQQLTFSFEQWLGFYICRIDSPISTAAWSNTLLTINFALWNPGQVEIYCGTNQAPKSTNFNAVYDPDTCMVLGNYTVQQTSLLLDWATTPGAPSQTPVKNAAQEHFFTLNLTDAGTLKPGDVKTALVLFTYNHTFSLTDINFTEDGGQWITAQGIPKSYTRGNENTTGYDAVPVLLTIPGDATPGHYIVQVAAVGNDGNSEQVVQSVISFTVEAPLMAPDQTTFWIVAAIILAIAFAALALLIRRR